MTKLFKNQAKVEINERSKNNQLPKRSEG